MNLNILCRQNFKIVEKHFAYLSTAGVIIAISLLVVAILGVVTQNLWFPKLSARFESHKRSAPPPPLLHINGVKVIRKSDVGQVRFKTVMEYSG